MLSLWSISCVRYVIHAGSELSNWHLGWKSPGGCQNERKILAKATADREMFSWSHQSAGLWRTAAGQWQVLCSVSRSSPAASLQSAVRAQGTGTDVTSSRPHPFSTLPHPNRRQPSRGHRPALPPPPLIQALYNLFRVCLESCRRTTKLKVCRTLVSIVKA